MQFQQIKQLQNLEEEDNIILNTSTDTVAGINTSTSSSNTSVSQSRADSSKEQLPVGEVSEEGDDDDDEDDDWTNDFVDVNEKGEAVTVKPFKVTGIQADPQQEKELWDDDFDFGEEDSTHQGRQCTFWFMFGRCCVLCCGVFRYVLPVDISWSLHQQNRSP